jgi:hypothetical protein
VASANLRLLYLLLNREHIQPHSSPFYQDSPIYWSTGSDDSLDLHGVSFYLPFFISNFSNLCLFPSHFSQIGQGIVYLVYFFKEPTFCFVDSSDGFLVYISLILALIFLFLSFSLVWVLLALGFLEL